MIRTYGKAQSDYLKAKAEHDAAYSEFQGIESHLMDELDAGNITFDEYAERATTYEDMIVYPKEIALRAAETALIEWAISVVEKEQAELWSVHRNMIKIALEASKTRVTSRARLISICMKLQPAR